MSSPSSPKLQASAVPFRQIGSKTEFCLITSRNTGEWSFPKGSLDGGESFAQAALRESEEEAGLRGQIIDPPLGDYLYSKAGETLKVVVLLMRVTLIHDRWHESQARRRIWAPEAEALRLLQHPGLKSLLIQAADRIRHLEPPTDIPPLPNRIR